MTKLAPIHRSCPFGVAELGALGLMIVLAVGCSKASEESSAKRSPVPPPPQTVAIPVDLAISVEIDGQPAKPINRASLVKLPADFNDGERSAWKLTRLIGAPLQRPGAVVEALSASGVAVSLQRPGGEGASQPVLFLTRRGDVIVALVDPANPFPKYHGQGGRLRRPGDPRPRLSKVSSLRVFVQSSGDRDEWKAMEQSGKRALSALTLQVGAKAQRPTAEQLEIIPTLTILGDQGDKRIVWSLRDVVSVLVGEGARPIKILGDDDEPLEISVADWDNAKQTPILRVNRRGEIKFQWIETGGAPREEGQMRGVMKIEVTPAKVAP